MLLKEKLILTVVLIPMIFYGCIDSPVIPQGNITGKVYDEFGMVNPFTYISSGDYPISGIDRFGSFSVEKTLLPFDLIVGNSYAVTKYTDLSSTNLKVCSFSDYGYGRGCDILVSFPYFKFGSTRAFVKFISSDTFTQFQYNAYSDSLFSTTIAIMVDKDFIEGKLIYLQYTDYSNIYSYDKYGIKDVVIYPGANPVIRFTEDDINYNPDELSTDYHVQVPPNAESYYFEASLSFNNMAIASELKIHGHYQGINIGSVKIPVIPSLDYRVKFSSFVSYSSIFNYEEETCKKWFFYKPGEEISYVHNKTLKLFFPEDGSENISDTTHFIFSDAEEPGIYIYRIISADDYNFLHIITDSYPLQLSDFQTRGITFRQGSSYYWSVTKYPGYKNIDEFASIKFMEDTVYTSIPASESRYFHIK